MGRFSMRGGGWRILVVLTAYTALSFGPGRVYAGTLPWTEKIVPLKPSITFVKASFLTGEMEGLRVVERVQPGTGKVMGTPRLEATLTVANDSRDHAARLLGGKIEYIDGKGNMIPITGNDFVFTRPAPDRLDPGQTVSQQIEVAFPPLALQPQGLREVSLELTFLPIPYETDTVYVPVHLGG